MQIDPASAGMRRYRPRRTTADRVCRAILELCDGHAEILLHQEKSWASITFAGTRHELTISFTGDENIRAGEQLIAILPDFEFKIPGQLVADATVKGARHSLLPQPRMIVEIMLLLLEDA